MEWVLGRFDQIVAEFTKSMEAFPNVPPNARDPYTPPRRYRVS